MNVLVVADTHVPDHAASLPSALVPHLEWADAILHGGDATAASVLDELSAYAPVHAVLGNIDRSDVAAWGAAGELELVLEGARIGMVHDSGSRHGRERRLRQRFPRAGVIVFAHSHAPVNEVVDGVRFLNPGSPTWKRRAPEPTVARMTVADGRAEAALHTITR